MTRISNGDNMLLVLIASKTDNVCMYILFLSGQSATEDGSILRQASDGSVDQEEMNDSRERNGECLFSHRVFLILNNRPL